jgi:hypothetical protein
MRAVVVLTAVALSCGGTTKPTGSDAGDSGSGNDAAHDSGPSWIACGSQKCGPGTYCIVCDPADGGPQVGVCDRLPTQCMPTPTCECWPGFGAPPCGCSIEDSGFLVNACGTCGTM